MNQELIKQRAALWANALDENDGKEAKHVFRHGNLRCCLCVAADVAVESLGAFASEKVESGKELPVHEVAEWYGWDSIDPKIGNWHATLLNDSLQLSHREIAARVREHYKLPTKETSR